MPSHIEANGLEGPLWRMPDGTLLSCREKLRALNAAHAEFRELASELLADAVVMGCDETATRTVLKALIEDLPSPFPERLKK